MMLRRLHALPLAPFAAALVLAAALPALAHHGVASLGAAGLEGPGAPVETSASATLPRGSLLLFLKLDQAEFATFTDERDDEGTMNRFWLYGAGVGLTPWLSAYAVFPYNVKVMENNAYNTAGFADPSLLAVLGLKWDGGLRRVPAGESLDDLEDWHFTLYGGMTLPLGDPDLADSEGALDPGLATGFGEPSFTLGLTGTKVLASRHTLTGELSWIHFSEHVYADGAAVRFGDEQRANLAYSLRLAESAARRFRLDGNFEGSYLALGRDEAEGLGETATGGRMLYLMPGLRAYYNTLSLGLGLKFPSWTDLNEEPDQQGAEGKEDYRLVVSFSALN
jgi:hypothetical protein